MKLWAFGGSIIGGIDLDDVNQSYANLLANHYSIEIENKGTPAVGVRYSYELLSNANIQPGDIVLIDMTLPDWIRFSKDGKVKNLGLKDLDNYEIKFWSDDQVLYEHFSFVDIIVKYCRLLDVKFVIHSFINGNSLWDQCQIYYSRYPEYMDFSKDILDYSDKEKLHPGVATNALIANKLKEHIHEYVNMRR
jgi:hypothetical protein